MFKKYPKFERFFENSWHKGIFKIRKNICTWKRAPIFPKKMQKIGLQKVCKKAYWVYIYDTNIQVKYTFTRIFWWLITFWRRKNSRRKKVLKKFFSKIDKKKQNLEHNFFRVSAVSSTLFDFKQMKNRGYSRFRSWFFMKTQTFCYFGVNFLFIFSYKILLHFSLFDHGFYRGLNLPHGIVVIIVSKFN